MLGSPEILLLTVITLALVGYCLADAVRARSALRAAGQDGTVVWIVLLAVGLVIWPVGWVTAVLYLSKRRQHRTAT